MHEVPVGGLDFMEAKLMGQYPFCLLLIVHTKKTQKNLFP